MTANIAFEPSGSAQLRRAAGTRGKYAPAARSNRLFSAAQRERYASQPTLVPRLVAIVASALIGCSASAQPAAPVEPEFVASVSGPTVIGFFPPITEKERDEDDGGLSEGYAHLSFALEDLEKCLAPRHLTVRLKITRSLQIQDGSTRHQLEFPTDWRHAIGIVLAEPGRSPEVIYATAGPSSLVELGPQAAWKYFSEPRCKRYDE